MGSMIKITEVVEGCFMHILEVVEGCCCCCNYCKFAAGSWSNFAVFRQIMGADYGSLDGDGFRTKTAGYAVVSCTFWRLLKAAAAAAFTASL